MTDNTEHSEADFIPFNATERSHANEMQVESAVKRHQGRSFLLPFNREERKQVQSNIIAELEMGFEYRRKALAVTLDARLQVIEESCNHVLMTGKTYLRQQRSQFFAKELMLLKHSMDEMADEFAINVDQRLEKVNKYSNQMIREREQERLEKSVVTFLDTLDGLVDDFINIVNESVHR